MQSLPNEAIVQKIQQTRLDGEEIAGCARLVIRYGMHCSGT
jgi:hypothetical protein